MGALVIYARAPFFNYINTVSIAQANSYIQIVKQYQKGVITINRKDLPESNATCETCGHKYRICQKCLKLRSNGIEAWRQHCDCIECYQIYIFLNQDPQSITEEEYERALEIELPEGHEFTEATKEKFDNIKKMFQQNKTQSTQVNTQFNRGDKDRIDRGQKNNYNRDNKVNKFGYNKGK